MNNNTFTPYLFLVLYFTICSFRHLLLFFFVHLFHIFVFFYYVAGLICELFLFVLVFAKKDNLKVSTIVINNNIVNKNYKKYHTFSSFRFQGICYSSKIVVNSNTTIIIVNHWQSRTHKRLIILY